MFCATIFAHMLTAFFIFFRKKVYCYISMEEFNIKELKRILHYSIPLIPNALSWWVLNTSDRTIVLCFLGTSFNGFLSVGHKFSAIYIHFYHVFNISWTESASLHMRDEDKEEFFSGVITNMFKIFMCIAIGIVACMPFAFPILIHSKFQEAYGLIPIFMLSSMLNVVVGLYSAVYVALKRTKEEAKTSICSGIINIVVHLILIQYIGLYASAISTVVAFGVMVVYRYFDSKKYININLPRKWILLVTVLYVIVCVAYYSKRFVLQIMVLVLVVIFSLVINRTMLRQGLKMLRSKLRK